MKKTVPDYRLSFQSRGVACRGRGWLLSAASVLSLCSLLVTEPAFAQDADGERLFRQRCGACHSLDPAQTKPAPYLSGLFGRRAGEVEGARYSDAIKASGVIWDRESLDTFLAAPRQMIRGTTMPVSLPNAAQRAAIISYLESL